VGFYWISFRLLLAKEAGVALMSLLPGASAGAVGFTVLITVGTGLVQHQLRNEGAVYGAFASVIGVVTFLLLLSKLTLYAAELNPVLARRMYPRALPMTGPLPADRQSLEYRAREESGRPQGRVDVAFDPKESDPAPGVAHERSAEQSSGTAHSGANGR
jgi:uncharacterized BrkB/YihY/UPF0761 family membrane protein